MPGHTKCCTCYAKSSQQTWRSEAPKWNPSEEISALTFWHLWWTCLLYCAGHAKCIFADILQMSHACQCFWNCYKTLTFCSLVTRCTIPSAYHAKRHLNVQKCSRTLSFFALLTSKCASRHNGVHFFDISTSKSGPTLVCFVHFDFNMCFAPQRRALFRHRNFKKWSDPGVLCTFWLRNVLRATTACNLSSLIWPNGSAPAALASLLFDPPEPQIIVKTQCFATFLPFRASASSFFWLFLFSDLLSSTLLFSLTLPISAFHLSILSEVWLLNFLRSGTYFKWLDVDLGTYQEDFASYLRTILQRIRNVLQVTWRRRYNISGTSFKLLQDVKTCQDRLASYLQKIFRRIRNIFKLLECNVTTYQECLESDLQNMLQRMRIHHAGPLSPPHVPAPCPQVLP